MSNELCPTCDQALPHGHAFFIGKAIETNYTGYSNVWHEWSEEDEGFSKLIPGLGTVTLIAKCPSLGESQGDDERPIFLIFECGGHFYRKNGFADSYGEQNWTGPFKDAKKVVKQVEAWE